MNNFALVVVKIKVLLMTSPAGAVPSSKIFVRHHRLIIVLVDILTLHTIEIAQRNQVLVIFQSWKTPRLDFWFAGLFLIIRCIFLLCYAIPH